MVTYDLIQQCACGDLTAKTRLIEENTGLIYSVVGRFNNRGIEAEDLFQLAAIGLLKAAENFNCDLGLMFSTYAVPMMMGEIRRHLRDNGPVKVSRSYKALAYKAARARETFINENGREPTVSEIAVLLSVDVAELSAALTATEAPASLEEPRGDDGGTLKDLIPGDDREDAILTRLALSNGISRLSEREQKIILLRYVKEQTQSHIAQLLGISQVQVSRLEKQILQKLKATL